MNNNPYTKQQLEALICEVMGIKTITPMIARQINKYILDYDMTFKEIARCIVWYTEVAQKTFDPLYGIGMVPNVREPAAAYFKQLELDQQRQQAEAKKVVEYQDNNIIFNINSLKHKKKQPKQIDISQIDVKGDNK